MKKGNKIVGWLLLIVLIAMIIGLNYVKFFIQDTTNITEVPIETTKSEIVEKALTEIVNNFNQNSKLEEYQNENIKINALLNNYTIFISYETDIRMTYEFNYDNLELRITIQNEKENIERFNKIYELLIYAVQARLNNENNIEDKINKFFNEDEKIEGITKEIGIDNITYTMNITKKIENESTTEETKKNEENSTENNTIGEGEKENANTTQ